MHECIPSRACICYSCSSNIQQHYPITSNISTPREGSFGQNCNLAVTTTPIPYLHFCFLISILDLIKIFFFIYDLILIYINPMKHPMSLYQSTSLDLISHIYCAKLQALYYFHLIFSHSANPLFLPLSYGTT